MYTLEEITKKYQISDIWDYSDLLHDYIEGNFSYIENNKEIINTLINEVTFPDNYYYSFIYTAAMCNNIYVLDKILNHPKIDEYSKYYDGKEQFYHAFWRAALAVIHVNRPDLLKILMNKFNKVNYSYSGNALLTIAKRKNFQDIIHLLENEHSN